MEKLYRIKEEVKKYFGGILNDSVEPIRFWQERQIVLEALEEVPQRVELEYHFENTSGLFDGVRRKDGLAFGGNMVKLMQKAYNGELIDLDSIDDEDFQYFYSHNICHLDNTGAIYYEHKGIKAVLKAYLKQRDESRIKI